MKAFEILMDEHRVIEQVLKCLEKLADRCEADQNLDGDSAREALAFFQNFADRCHHGKEEDYLFPLLESRGFRRQGGPTGLLLQEHDDGRGLIAAMANSIECERPSEFVRHARAYARLLREHIRKEDQCLFPMAAEILSDEDAESLAFSFDYVEHADMGEGAHEQFLNLANDLADRLGVPQARVTPTCGHACSHHHPP